ncbi:unnamed protein product [Rhizoctonia solani]|uniref:Mid2 domain-containing protein n=1 Tax=Rhizoctonia solani TaxID=456999 RepID=A0A8H3E775_9AGAM|nr:unnamed protein product [Rhizoctonia solani]
MKFSTFPLVLVAFLATANIQVTFAQVTSNVTTCVQDYQWTINSMNQTPCLQSGYLSAQCNGGSEFNSSMYLVNSLTLPVRLERTWHPEREPRNRKGTGPPSVVGSYPRQLPPYVTISGWAYLDFTSQGTFQPQAAREAAATVSGSVSAPGQTQGAASVGTVTVTSTATPTPDGSSSNAGAIAGGVVGGVASLALLIILAWFLLRKRAAIKGDPGQGPLPFMSPILERATLENMTKGLDMQCSPMARVPQEHILQFLCLRMRSTYQCLPRTSGHIPPLFTSHTTLATHQPSPRRRPL